MSSGSNKDEAVGLLLTGWKTGVLSSDEVVQELFKHFSSKPVYGHSGNEGIKQS